MLPKCFTGTMFKMLELQEWNNIHERERETEMERRHSQKPDAQSQWHYYK